MTDHKSIKKILEEELLIGKAHQKAATDPLVISEIRNYRARIKRILKDMENPETLGLLPLGHYN